MEQKQERYLKDSLITANEEDCTGICLPCNCSIKTSPKRVKTPKTTKTKKGVAFVSMQTWQQASAAATALNGVVHQGSPLAVKISEASAKQAGAVAGGGGLDGGLGAMRGASGTAAALSATRFSPYGGRAAAGGAGLMASQVAGLQTFQSLGLPMLTPTGLVMMPGSFPQTSAPAAATTMTVLPQIQRV